MKTQITNLLTGDKAIFVNDHSLTENIISLHIFNQKRVGNILNKEYRKKLFLELDIKESVSTVTGQQFAYCEKLDLHAKFINN